LAGIAAKMVDEPFKLLIVDSIMANFRWVGWGWMVKVGLGGVGKGGVTG